MESVLRSEAGEGVREQNVATTAKSMKEVFGGMPQPDSIGDGDALAMGKPGIE